MSTYLADENCTDHRLTPDASPGCRQSPATEYQTPLNNTWGPHMGNTHRSARVWSTRCCDANKTAACPYNPRCVARFVPRRASRLTAPVAQWIEQPPPKGQVGRSIRLRGARVFKGLAHEAFQDSRPCVPARRNEDGCTWGEVGAAVRSELRRCSAGAAR